MAALVSVMLGLASRAWGAGWELRRRAYAAGLKRPQRVAARVVSLGNLTAGGTGKTTLALHLARRARERGIDVAIVCRRYHPGPAGHGDEELMLRRAFGEPAVYAGHGKRADAARAAADGHRLVLVDDGFSHWGLERDLDVVLLDANDPWGGRRLLPAGRLREPLRALQRAGVVVLTRLAPDADPSRLRAEVAGVAPAARIALARHRVTGVRALAGGEAPRGRVRVVTATGNPRAVEATARESGLEVTGLSAYRDHHWFSVAEARAERERAARDRARVVVTAKDAVRWPAGEGTEVDVLEVEWEWLGDSAAVDDAILRPGGGA